MTSIANTAEQTTIAQLNEAGFNKFAAQNMDRMPQSIERGKRVAAGVRTIYEFNKDSTTVLDFACGSGLVARELAPHVKSIFGIDISQGSVDQFNERAREAGFAPAKLRAEKIELKGEAGELGDEKFDVVICTQAYHHITDVVSITKTLTHFLKPGGALLVVDDADSSGHGHHHHNHNHHNHHNHNHGHGHADDHHTAPAGTDNTTAPAPTQENPDAPNLAQLEKLTTELGHTVVHKHGFTADEMKTIFEGAGLSDFVYDGETIKVPYFSPQRFGEDGQKLFVAKGIKKY